MIDDMANAPTNDMAILSPSWLSKTLYDYDSLAVEAQRLRDAVLADAMRLRDEAANRDATIEELKEELAKRDATLEERMRTIDALRCELASAQRAPKRDEFPLPVLEAWAEVGRLHIVAKMAKEDAHAAKARVADRDAKLLSIKLAVDKVNGISGRSMAMMIKAILEGR